MRAVFAQLCAPRPPRLHPTHSTHYVLFIMCLACLLECVTYYLVLPTDALIYYYMNLINKKHSTVRLDFGRGHSLHGITERLPGIVLVL